jgi:predicted phage terminase large subunit-like protein
LGRYWEAVRAERAKRAQEAERRRVAADVYAIRDRCRSLAGFVREAWHVLEPTTPLKWSWHLDAMCEHLEAISRGTMSPWLIINIPPGSSKSTIVSVMWQAWEWGPLGRPSSRFLTTSFEEENVKRDTRRTRDLIRSEWFKALWPDVMLTRAGETSFANSSTGTREGVPFASITGKRGDRVVIDDPHSLKGAESEGQRNEATRLFLEGGLNRLNDQMTSAIVVVMQRLHETDLTGVLLARKLGFVHLMIPMEYEPERSTPTPIGWTDPRTYDGELMDPVRMPREAADKLKSVSSYSWAGQYQQRPTAREGGLFKRSWFEIVGAVPVNAKRARAWDLAASTGARSDWTAGVKVSRDPQGTFYVEHVARDRWTPADVERIVRQYAQMDTTATAIRLPQDPGQAGKAQAQTLVRMLAGYDVKATPVTGSKEVRATPAAAQAEAQNVKIVAGPWNEAFLDELCTFPSGAHDDQVDAFADALNALALARSTPTASSASFSYG